jgi:hypothetical protein
MMTNQIDTFRNVLKNIEKYTGGWVFLPTEGKWRLESKSVILKLEEVPPEMEDEPDAGVPEFAKQNHLTTALCVSNIQDIVNNAKMQILNPSDEQLFEAFMYYHENDAFIDFNANLNP